MMTRAVEYLELELAEIEPTTAQVPFLVQKLAPLGVYVQAGRPEDAERNYEAVEDKLRPPFDKLLSIGRATIALELEEPDAAEAALVDLEEFIQAFGAQALMVRVFYTRGGVQELRGEYHAAIDSYRAQLEFDHTNATVKRAIGRCYRKLGNLEEAEELLNEARTSIPADPRVLYELALVSADAGDTDVAVERLESALDVWADADSEFKEAREARAKLAGLRAANQ